MDDNLYFDSMKSEKAMARNMTMSPYSTLKRIAKCFRTLEISLSIFFLVYLFTHLPLVLRLSGEYFRCLSSTLTSPLSVFLILNTLVIFLYQNYNNATTPTTLHNHHQVETNNHPDPAYTTSTSLSTDSIDRCDPPEVPSSGTELVVYHDKEVIICEEKVTEKPADADDVTVNREVKRSQSQGQGTRRKNMHSGKVLSRSKTTAEEMKEMELSSEEFRRTIEEFLQKQKKFHHLENLSSAAAVVV